MVLRVLAVFAFLCLYGIPAFANGGGGVCVSVNDLAPWQRVQALRGAPLIPDGSIGGENAQRIVSLYNSTPPESDYVADTIIVYAVPRQPAVVIFLVRDDCIVEMGGLPNVVWDRWVGEPM